MSAQYQQNGDIPHTGRQVELYAQRLLSDSLLQFFQAKFREGGRATENQHLAPWFQDRKETQ